MDRLNKNYLLAATLLLQAILNTANAADVKIIAADFRSSNSAGWSVSVTLKHADAGWKHYADNWRIVDGEGNILGDRVLYHPHVEEQPFTRGLRDVKVPDGINIVYIEAHDKVHGWTPNRLKIDLTRATDGRLKVMTK